ncbi:Alcohol-forming fatty acyl-CoA reductase-like protein [Drosera capensis]
MEIENINQFLDGKTFLVTGATGLIAKILIEKLLRVQPNLKKLYILVREKNGLSARERLKREIIDTELFDVLRGKWGTDFDSLILQKVVAVAGELACENLGVHDRVLREEMWREIEVVFHVAATTNFYERYDVAFNTNTMGVMHVVDFAKKSEKIRVLLHVSTAYVSQEKTGLITEKPLQIGEALKGNSKLDIDAEKRLINETLENLISKQVSEDSIKKTMRELGQQRAKQYGWPHVYVFTKSMGEMLIGQLKGNLPVVILRPTIITSTYKEPIPGWIEGLRMMDPILVAYGKGTLNYCFCKGGCFIDLIPADMVVNSMIVAAIVHANRHPCLAVYQLGSSFRNPLTMKGLADLFFRYFSEKPLANNEGTVRVRRLVLLGNLLVFVFISWLFVLVIKVLRVVDMVSMHRIQGFVDRLHKKSTAIAKLVGVYKPYLCYDGIFKDDGTEELRIAARKSGINETTFFFDPTIINWEDYFLRVHIPGVIKRQVSSKPPFAMSGHTNAGHTNAHTPAIV